MAEVNEKVLTGEGLAELWSLVKAQVEATRERALNWACQTMTESNGIDGTSLISMTGSGTISSIGEEGTSQLATLTFDFSNLPDNALIARIGQISISGSGGGNNTGAICDVKVLINGVETGLGFIDEDVGLTTGINSTSGYKYLMSSWTHNLAVSYGRPLTKNDSVVINIISTPSASDAGYTATISGATCGELRYIEE